jgi:hypothetical protein
MEPVITDSLSNFDLIVVLIELLNVFKLPVVVSIESTRFFVLRVVDATDEDKLPIEELSPLVVVANELDKEPIDDVNDELTLVIVLVNPLVVVATDEDTEELNDCKSIPSTLPVNSIDPLTIILLPKTILVPPDEVILKPSCICVVPLIDMIPFVGSNNMSPPPDDFNSISPSADCNIIESEPASNILIDCPVSVVIVSS